MSAEVKRYDSPVQRAEMLEPGYSPGWHLVRTLTLLSAIVAFSLWLARGAAAVDWLLMPAFFVVANFIEWAVHKGPMHRPLTPRILYVNHTLVHHRAFLHESMPINDTRELGLIMMPWYTMLGLFAVSSPVALLAAWWRGWGAAGIFFLSAALYFAAYETLHAFYHLPENTLRKMGLGGPLFRKMRGHHRHHHRLDRMSHVNFNVTFPLMDTLLGTREAETEAPALAAPPPLANTGTDPPV